MLIASPGIYNLTAEQYHADPVREPSLSSSIAKLLVVRTPRHAWTEHPRFNPDREDDEEHHFDIGTACHSLILNDPIKFAIITADSWRTKDAKDQRDAARLAGKLPLLEKHWDQVQAMAAAARAQLEMHEDASGAFLDGLPEQTLIWQEGAVWCRVRLDWLPASAHFFDDYKSTECADPDVFQRQMINLGYDIQAAFYCRGIRALDICERPEFRFIVQEREPPHALCVISPLPGMIELAERKVEKALQLWAACRREGRWPGYPARTCYVGAPAYHEAQYLEREVRDHDARAGKSELAAAIDWQAPL